MNEPTMFDMSLLRAGCIELYRRWDRDGRSVLLATTSLDSSSGRPLVLRSERELAERLATSWALRPLRISHRLDQLQLTLSDPGGSVLREMCGTPLEIGRFLTTAVALTRAIREMHGQGIVHRDLAPENILFEPDDGRAWITGLGNATLGGADFRRSAVPPVSTTSVHYLAPELSGTINRPVDARADLYSLGCILYELITGSPPVATDDPSGAVHSHLAMLPLAANIARSDCPEVLSMIVATLLAKDPNDRYSSAEGLLGDLLRCQAAWRDHARIEWFPVDHANATRRLNASDRLYGRDFELKVLHDALQDVSRSGAGRCVVLSGGSGTGKSALVRNFERALDEKAHSFGAGKCGQVEDVTPYGCLTMALNDLLHDRLGRGGRECAVWSRRLTSALGSSLALLRTLLPDLGLIVDDLPCIESGPMVADQDRLFEAICKLIGCFAADQCPLVLFLDDLQWADSGTVNALRHMLHAKDLQNVLLVFALREERGQTLCSIREILDDASLPIKEVTLGPLAFVDLNRLVGDILGCSPASTIPLSGLIQTKTGANPFFVIRFLLMLLEEGLIRFDSANSSWQWDLPRTRATKYTSNVAELLLDELSALPAETLDLLRYMACLGDRGEPQTLAVAAGIEEHTVHTLFGPAERAGLVRWNATAYSFLHDRIREAIYHTLVKDGSDKGMHAAVGKRLANLHPYPSGGLLFAAANQINLGADLIHDRQEKRRYAGLNLDAAILAKKSADYRAAISYLEAASFLLRHMNDQPIANVIEFHRAECEFVTAELSAAEARLERLWHSDIDAVLKSSVARLRVSLYTTLGHQRVAVEVGLSYLAGLGIILPVEPSDEDIEQDRAKLVHYIDHTRIDANGQPRMKASSLWAGAMDVLGDLVLPALFCNNGNLVDGLGLTAALMTAEHGYCSASNYAYVHAAGILAYRFRDVERSLLLGERALRLSSDEGFDRLAARVRLCFGVLVIPWTRPIRNARRFIREAAKAAYDSCDLTYAVYSQRNLISNLLFSGAPLGEVMRATEDAVDFAHSAGFQLLVDTILAQLMVVSTLRGTHSQTFASRGLKSDWSDSLTHGAACTSTGAFAYWVHQLQIRVLFRDWEGALEAEQKAAGLLGASIAHIETADLPYYGALCRAAAFFNAKDLTARRVHEEALQKHRDYLQLRAETCPENFADRAALAAAELARVQGRTRDAQLLYEQAIELARKQDFVQNEGVALEAAANFYASQNLPAVSESLLGNARYAFLHWGADAKAQDVESRMTRISGRQGAKPSSDLTAAHLDTRAVVTASHALSSEIMLPRLLETLIGNVLKHAGAERCAVVLHRKGVFRVEAEAKASLGGATYVIESRELAEAALPMGIFMRVARTHQRVLLDDALRAGEFARDRDVIQHRLRSVLCMPLLKQSELVGILYVENNLLSGAFTEEKTALLEVFASQAAILLENARLYADTLESNALREAAERALRDSREELSRVASLTTMGQLAASIAHEVSQPLVSIATSAGAALRFMKRDEPDLIEVEDALERIQFDSTRAHDVVRSLRALVKRSAPSFSAFDLNDAIHEVLLITRSQLEKHSVRLDSNGIAGEKLVSGDRVQIQQVVLNLVVNAIEAMNGICDRERRLSLRSEAREGRVMLTVEDSGVGIGPGPAENIFAPFVTSKQNGMGMGLPICLSIMRAHSGRLAVKRLSPFGTRFEVTLPEPSGNSAKSVSCLDDDIRLE